MKKKLSLIPEKWIYSTPVQAMGKDMSSIINFLKDSHGQFLFKDVPAMIAPNLGQPLLGMNVLQQFRIEQDNGEMRLTPNN